MSRNLISLKTPEQIELEVKQEELRYFEQCLLKQEVEFISLKTELRIFENQYYRTVGIKYAELDEIFAQISELVAKRNPEDKKAAKNAEKSRAQAEETAGAVNEEKKIEFKKSTPDPSIKELFRKIAKSLHPDLTVDEKEKEIRTRLMAEANLAYSQLDEIKLQRILDEWQSGPNSVKGDDIGAELIKLIRKIKQIKNRLLEIKKETKNIKKSELYKLEAKVKKAEKDGRDLLQDMAIDIEKKIKEAKHDLEVLLSAEKTKDINEEPQRMFICKIGSGDMVFNENMITLDLKSKKKEEVINEITELFVNAGIVKDGREFYKRVIKRERLGPTGIGEGLAIPYAKVDEIEEGAIFIALAISKDGVDFDSLDGEPVHLIFLSASNSASDGLHLKYRAKLSRIMKDESVRKTLINAESKEEAFYLLKSLFKTESS